MLYFANPCSDDVIALMGTGVLGLIDTPVQKKVAAIDKAHAVGAVWCADNGAYADGWVEEAWWAFLLANVDRVATCAFAVAPDVVGDAAATLARSAPWLPRIASLGYPVAYVAQDGFADHPPPWELVDVLFLGGTDDFKLGPAGIAAAAEAKSRGKKVHMGRVNSARRFAFAKAIGCDSADGTFLTFGPTKNLPRLRRWLHVNDQYALF